MREAAERASRGEGPSLIECVTYRWEPHSIFTRQEIRPQDEIENWKRKDPIARYQARLLELKIATPDALAQVELEVSAEITSAVEFAKKSPRPESEVAFQHLFV